MGVQGVLGPHPLGAEGGAALGPAPPSWAAEFRMVEILPIEQKSGKG